MASDQSAAAHLNNGDGTRSRLNGSSDKLAGHVDAFVHHARDIHNICIYHKQDVYAKLYLTTDPEHAGKTKTINGGGQNPVFDDGLRLDVRNVESSLRCEIWMMSRVKNYLEDQLLGFALVPLADIMTAADGRLIDDFSLSANDFFHSPAGFVRLSLTYVGHMPEVISIPKPLALSECCDGNDSVPNAMEQIEFPDLNVVQENQVMVSEYFGMSCAAADTTQNPCENGHNEDDTDAGVQAVVSESPLSCVSTVNSPAVQSASDHSVDTVAMPITSKEDDKATKEGDHREDEADSSNRLTAVHDTVIQPVISIKIDLEQPVIGQDIADMYMRSMQQSTESLAKLKLPLDIENGSPSGTETEAATAAKEEKKSPSMTGSPAAAGARVFYGSRAFF